MGSSHACLVIRRDVLVFCSFLFTLGLSTKSLGLINR